MVWSLDEVWEALTGEPAQEERGEQSFGTVVVDTRGPSQRSLFVALPGDGDDGHDHVARAFQVGAGAAIVERPLEACRKMVQVRADARPVTWPGEPFCLEVEKTQEALWALGQFRRSQIDARVIVVMASTASAAAKQLIAAALGQSFETLMSPAGYADEVGVPLTLTRLETPHQRVVLELGIQAATDTAQLVKLARPQVGVVTDLGQPNQKEAGEAITEMLRSLPTSGAAILNGDAPQLEALASSSGAPVLRFGLAEACDFRASEIESLGLEGIKFRLRHGPRDVFVRIPLLGRHSVHTALAAAAVGAVEGEPWEQILAGLQTVPEQLRLIAVPGIKDSTIIDDTYNANPTSTLAALNLLEELEGRRVAVLGDMLGLGSDEERGHRLVGHRAAEVVARLVTVGARARLIAEGARAAGLKPGAVLEVDDNAHAVDALGQLVAPGDIILVKGSRATRMEEIVEKLTAGSHGGSGGPWPPR